MKYAFALWKGQKEFEWDRTEPFGLVFYRKWKKKTCKQKTNHV